MALVVSSTDIISVVVIGVVILAGAGIASMVKR
jgi:hypothetical protein